MKVTALVMVNWRTRKTANGSIGADEDRSTRTKANPETMPTASMATTAGALQPRAGPSIRAKVTPASASVASTAPGTSICPVALGSCDSGTWRTDSRSTTAPTGTLTRKMNRHDAAAIR